MASRRTIPKSPQNVRTLITTLGGGSEAAQWSGVPYNRLRSIMAGTSKANASERVRLAFAARDARGARALVVDMQNAGLTRKEIRSRMSSANRVIHRGHARDKEKLVRGVRLSSEAYQVLFGRLRA